MSINASRSSLYEEITLEKEGSTSVGLEGRTVRFVYFESLFSPYVSADLVYIDTGNGLTANGTDTQERLGTIKSSFPISGGGEETIKFKITNTLGSLDFTSYPLVVKSAPTLVQESTRELVTLKLVSPAAIKNENTIIHDKYYNNITNSVSSIITDKLEVPSTKIFLDQTQNSLSFIGSGRKPFDLIVSCARQSMPLQGSAGFLFWENKNGFNFKSVDNIIAQTPAENTTYKYYGVYAAGLNASEKNYRILGTPSFKEDQNLVRALRSGMYRTYNTAFNPYTGQVTELPLTLDSSGIVTLGSTPDYSSTFVENNVYTKINHFIIDSGNMQSGIGTAVNNDQLQYFAKAAMRYNIFLSQIVDITVPANPNLKAGDVITCEFEKVTISNKNLGSIDQRQSGKYVIMNLCHYFTPTNSFTNMRLVRDTYGLYTSGGV